MRVYWQIVLLCVMSTITLWGTGNWKTYTAKREIRAIASNPLDTTVLWVATNGGMFSYRLNDSAFQQYTTSEGLRTNDLTAITVDSHGDVWIGASNGYIHRFSPSQNTWQYITDIFIDKDHGPNKKINALQMWGDTLFILSDIGVSVYSISHMEFRETYTRFGTVSTQLVGNVTGLQIFNGKIWISTQSGIASTPLTNLNPSSPDSWEVFTRQNGLASNVVNKLGIHEGKLAAATTGGLNILTDSGWSVVSGTLGFNVIDFKLIDHTCLVCASYFITSNNQLWAMFQGTNIQQVNQFSVSLTVLLSQNIFGTVSNGLMLYKDTTSQFIIPTGPPSNKFVGIAIDQKGVLWSGTGTRNGEGFMSFDGKSWRLYNRENNPRLRFNEYYKVSIGRDNSKWISSWGAGVALVDDGGKILKVFNTTNGIPPCITNDLSYAVVGGVAVDQNGITWITSRTPPGDTSLVLFKPDSSLNYIVGCGFQCTMRNPDNVFTDVVIDQYGTKWFANFNRFEPESPTGFYYYNENYALPGTTNGWGKLSSADGLTSDKVWCLAVDREGGVWIGSDQGITIIFDPSNPKARMSSYHPLRDQVVQAIAVDALDNKWVATKQGVFVLSSDGTSILERYTAENTNGKLVDNDITSIAIDHNTGIIYFGTEKGLVSFSTPAIAPRQTFGELTFSPNPFFLPTPITLTIDGLVRSSSLKILTINGTLVKEIVTPGGRVGYWDGKNEQGDFVATGIYLVVGFSEDGNQTGTGKIAVIRK